MALMVESVPPSTSSEYDGIVGCTEPRLWTPPLRELTPATSYGFDVIDFARDVLGHPLDPWQEWVVIHAGELLPDGRPRFRRVLIMVARQNGKTELLVVLTLFWLFVERVEMVLGTSTKLDYAKESWRKACRLARRVPELAAEIPKKGGIRKANGEQELWRATGDEVELEEGSRYKIAPSNEEGGRSLTIDRLVLDELRHHYTYDAFDASEPATTAVEDAQIFAITNAGSDKSIVLNELREEALHFIESGEGDLRLGLFEYSAPEDASPVDVQALRQANPNLGIRKNAADLVAAGAAAMRQGGKKLAGFKTEQMCIHVRHMDPAVDPTGWSDGNVPGTLEGVRARLALVLDVSLDQQHAILVAAAQLEDGRVRVEAVKAWSGPQCTAEVRRDLRAVVGSVRPRKFGWIPNGPAAALAADLRKEGLLPRGTELEEIKSEIPVVCMGLAELVRSRDVLHSDDPLLNAHVLGAEKQRQGDRWVFIRRGAGHVNGAYATAGAVHLARTMPPEKPRSRVF